MSHYFDGKSALSDRRPQGGYGSLRPLSYHGADPVLGTTAGSMSFFPMGDFNDSNIGEEEIEALDDFVEDMIGSYFKISNPNASSTCGCGTSFSI